jgi:hypothetical protein
MRVQVHVLEYSKLLPVPKQMLADSFHPDFGICQHRSRRIGGNPLHGTPHVDFDAPILSPPPATAWAEGAQFNVPPFPATVSAEGAQLNVPPFPATVSAEGAQLNVPPSLRERVRVRGFMYVDAVVVYSSEIFGRDP